MEEITQLLWEAAQKKRLCRIQLNGEPLPRTIQPYGICRTSGNKIVLVCWQSLGFTKPGGKAGYRNLVLEDIEEVEMLDTHFSPDPGFNPTDPQYKDWVFHVSVEMGTN